jgi:hypothetical protein
MGVSGQLHFLTALLPVPLDRRLGGPQTRSGSCGVEKKILPLPGTEPQPSSLYPVTIPTELSRLPVTDLRTPTFSYDTWVTEIKVNVSSLPAVFCYFVQRRMYVRVVRPGDPPRMSDYKRWVRLDSDSRREAWCCCLWRWSLSYPGICFIGDTGLSTGACSDRLPVTETLLAWDNIV